MATGLKNNCCTPQKLSINNSTGYLSISDGNTIYLGTLIKTLGIKTPLIDFRLNGFVATIDYTDINGVIQSKSIDLSALALGGTFTVTDTSSVNLTYAAGNLSAAVNLSALTGNSLVMEGDGIFSPTFTETLLTANDSSTIDFTTSGTANHTITGSVKISANIANKLQVLGDGLMVPDMKTYFLPGSNISYIGTGDASAPYVISAGGFSQTPLSVSDSTSFHFISSGTNGMNLTGNVKLSALSGNALTVNSDGLFVPQASTNSYTDAQARASISSTAPILYNNTTGVISISLASSASNGYLTSSDWNSFNGRLQSAANLGSSASFPIYASQTGTQIGFNGIRAGSNIFINQVGNDIVISGAGSGSGSTSAVFTIDFIVGDGQSFTPTANASQFNPPSNPLIGKTILGFWVEGLKTAGVVRTGGELYYTFNPSLGTITLTNGVFSQDTYYSIMYK